MRKFNYIRKNDTTKELFFKFPKALIFDPRYKDLSANAKILYSILLDRASVSEKNGFIDDFNRVYVICEIDEMELFLTCSRATISKLLKELEKHCLLLRVCRGQGKANLLYLAYPGSDEDIIDKGVKFHKRKLKTLKQKRKQENENKKEKFDRVEFYENKKFKNCNFEETKKYEDIENADDIDNETIDKSDDFNRCTKCKLVDCQEMNGNKTNKKDNIVVEEKGQTHKILLLKKYGFKINEMQEKLLEEMDFEILKDAVETTISKGGKVFAYIFEVYKGLKNKANKVKTKVNNKVKTAVLGTVTYNTNKNPKPNKFANFDQNFMDYSEEEFDRIVAKSQREKFGASLCW